jgi:hypothetical protein
MQSAGKQTAGGAGVYSFVMSPIAPRRSPVSLFAFLLLAGIAFVATGCFTPGWYPGGYGRGYGYGYGGGCGYGCGYGNGYYGRPYYNYGKPYYRYGYGGKGHHHDHDDDDDHHHGRNYEPYRGPSNGPSNGPPGSPPPQVSNEERARPAMDAAVQRNKSNSRQSRSGSSAWRGRGGSRD